MGYFNEYEEIINDGYHTYVEEELDQDEMYYDEVVKGYDEKMKKVNELEKVEIQVGIQHPCMYDLIRKAKGKIGREMSCDDCVNYSNCKWVEKGINDPEDCDDYQEEFDQFED